MTRASFKTLMTGLLSVVGLFALAFIAVNIGDEDLNPAVTARLASRPQVPEPVADGYRYEAKEFTRVEIPTTFKGCKDAAVCSQDELKTSKAAIERDIAANADLLAKYDELMSYPGAADDKPARIEKPSPAFALLKLSMLRRLGWNIDLEQRRYQRVIDQWTASNLFFSQSLNYPQTTLGTTIALTILKRNRDFARRAVIVYPEFKSFFSDRVLASATIKAAPRRLNEYAALTDLEIWNEITSWKFDRTMVEATSIAGSSKSSFFDPYKLFDFAYNPHQTMNRADALLRADLDDACVTTANACETSERRPVSSYFVNPIGNALLSMLSPHLNQRFQQIHRDATILAQPLAFD